MLYGIILGYVISNLLTNIPYDYKIVSYQSFIVISSFIVSILKINKIYEVFIKK